MTSPLDIAGQVTLIAWTLQELPDAQVSTDPILSRSLALAQIRDIAALKTRKLQGLSVFDQVQARAQATSKDVEQLKTAIETALTNLPPVEVPTGRPVPTGPNWSMPTTEASTITLTDVKYSPPLIP